MPVVGADTHQTLTGLSLGKSDLLEKVALADRQVRERLVSRCSNNSHVISLDSGG